MRAARAAVSSLREFITPARRVQAEADFQHVCLLLEMRERLERGVPDREVVAAVPDINAALLGDSLGTKMASANDRITTQLAEHFQALYDLDAGDVGAATAADAPQLPNEALKRASDTIGPGGGGAGDALAALHTQAAELAREDAQRRSIMLREYLNMRCGYSLWVGPSQAQTPTNTAGVYVKGYAAPGTVVGVYPGKVYSSEMLLKARDFGHLANPKVPRNFVVRFDGTLIDVNGVFSASGPESEDAARAGAPTDNPFALAHLVRHPPPDITPNVVRIQFDYIDDSASNSHSLLPMPRHLHPYIPNSWGSDVTLAQGFAGQLMDQGILMKGSVLVARRELFDEELFVDHQLNPFAKRPEWYTPRDIEADRRLWEAIVANSAAVKQAQAAAEAEAAKATEAEVEAASAAR